MHLASLLVFYRFFLQIKQCALIVSERPGDVLYVGSLRLGYRTGE